MLRYKVIDPKYKFSEFIDPQPLDQLVFVEAFLVLRIGERLKGHPELIELWIEGHGDSIIAHEILFAPINVGDYVRYDISCDEYIKITKYQLDNNKNLLKFEAQGFTERSVSSLVVVHPYEIE